MTELYSAQEPLESKLDRILAVVSNEPDKVDEVNKHLLACPRKDELEALSETMKSWTIRVENVSRELKDFKDFVDNDNLIIEVKDILLIKLNESCNDLQSQIDELRKSRVNNNGINGNNLTLHSEKSKIKIPIPIFKGFNQERPIKFLNDLEKYIAFMKIDGRESIQIVSQALEAAAKDWWHFHETDVVEYNQFKNLFKERFWNSTIQRQTSRKVEFGTFYAGARLNRVTFATTTFGYAKELELTYSDGELTEKLPDHFEKGIRHAFTDQQVKSKSTLFQILTNYDNDDKRAQSRKPNSEQYKSEVKSDERNEKPAKSHNRNQGQSRSINEIQQR